MNFRNLKPKEIIKIQRFILGVIPCGSVLHDPQFEAVWHPQFLLLYCTVSYVWILCTRTEINYVQQQQLKNWKNLFESKNPLFGKYFTICEKCAGSRIIFIFFTCYSVE